MDIPKVNQPVNEPYSVPFSYAPVNHWYGGDSSTYEMTKDKFALAADRTCKDQSGICKGPCKDDYVALNGVCYKYIHLQLCFADAEQYCKQNAPGGHLASIHCRLNHMFVTNVIEVSYITFPYTWLGGSDCNKEGIFVWTDGSPMDHTAWCPSEPFNANGKESCVALNHKSHFLWSSEDCNKQFNFVCAYKLACPSPDCSAC
uniref:C-type lectin domain-containing protein n=1 Tax=Callorhinchus milii TaxID=7868 RepID=A0A4W3IK10_CALMI